MMCEDPGGLTWKATVGAPDAVRIKHPLRRRCKCGMCTDLATGLRDLYFKYCEHLCFWVIFSLSRSQISQKKKTRGTFGRIGLLPADIQPSHLAQVQMGMPLCSATCFVYTALPKYLC